MSGGCDATHRQNRKRRRQVVPLYTVNPVAQQELSAANLTSLECSGKRSMLRLVALERRTSAVIFDPAG